MKRTVRKPRLERRRLADLIPYPRQKEHFKNLPAHKLQGMAEAARKGRLPPIEILPRNRAGLPENTILRGHQRRLAHELNGTTEVLVLVRYDLAGADEATIEMEFLADNLDRRHDDKLALARGALRRFELQRKRGGPLSGSEAADVRELVGREIGMSGRNLARYTNVLRTPVEVQNAVSDGRLRLVDAERVCWLSDAVQAEIARRIRGGEDPKEVVAPFASRKARYPGDPVVFLLRGLGRAISHVEGRMNELPPHRLRGCLSQLEHARTVLGNLISRATVGDAQDQREEEE